MSRRSKLLTFGLPLIGGAALLAGTGMVVENRPVAPEELPPRPPTTSPAVSDGIDVSRFIGAIGISEPRGEAILIAAHTSGVVESVAVAVGDEVAAGDALFIVERSRAEAEVALRRADVIVAEGELASLRSIIPPLRAGVRSAQAGVASAAADIRVAEADLADRENLVRIAESVADPRAIAAEEVDRRRFAASQAEARVATAVAGSAEAEARLIEAEAQLARYAAADSGADGPEIIAARARVTSAQRELDQAKADLALLTVRSPVAGRVLQVNIRAGEFAPASVPSEGLVVIGRGGPVHLRVEIDEVDIARFSPGSRAWASPRGDAGQRIDLQLAYVEPLVVPKANLSGRTSERVDTRVLQAVYEIDAGTAAASSIGQQFDVYIEASGGTP
ncbi:MAG: biotin/lipoyl-binding protein [Planctomycetota bacterium]